MFDKILARAYTFLLANGRLLERKLFEYNFAGGSAQAALAALRAYQNPDGGFGNALEPDKRTASSQPIDQEFALRCLDQIGMDLTLADQVCDYLESITTPQGGVPFVLPTVADAPRAPWWNTADEFPPASINPTASLAGLLHKHHVNHSWLKRASGFCWQIIDSLEEPGDHDLLCIVLFLENTGERARAAQAFSRLANTILEHTALNPADSGYVFKPLDWAPTPGSLCSSLYNDEIIQKHLHALAERQQEDGGWPLSWGAVSPACELEYRGIVTLNAVRTLKAYAWNG